MGIKNIFLVFLLSLFILNNLFAQNSSLKGYIYDKDTKEPLLGATVSIKNTNMGVSSNLFGYFQIDNIPAGKQVLTITYIGFENQEQEVEIKANQNNNLDFYLNPGTLQLADIVVTSGDRLKTNAINSVDVALRPVNSSQDILRIVPGLFIAQHAGGGKAEQIFLRGFDIDHGTDINLSVDGITCTRTRLCRFAFCHSRTGRCCYF